ncbi:MAG: glycosyltransferase family 2 protein [Acidobacteriaceae bacterium]
MNQERTKFSICIPAYNRARHLPALLDSILSQDYKNFNIVICEDNSTERAQISVIAQRYAEQYPGVIFYHENVSNFGYDKNIRRLVECATGEFCFFMGNDDILCPGALANVADILSRYKDVGLVLKSYAWFDHVPEQINQEVRYFNEERSFSAGNEAITVCFRRSGVISGYIVHRDSAHAAATDRFDGSLYYQMHLTSAVLAERCAIFTPKVLVLCRNGEPPEFGNSDNETGRYVPGHYTPQARLHMVGGALEIIKQFDKTNGTQMTSSVMRDYANYFYPYIRDQLKLPLSRFFFLYRSYGKMGFYKYPMFHAYFLLGYMLGEEKFDALTRQIRGKLGRSPQFGLIKARGFNK